MKNNWDRAEPMYEINPDSRISPEQADSIIIKAGKDVQEMPGYRSVTPMELRELYGLFINHNNLHMPMAQYLSMMLDIVRTISSYRGVHICKLPLDSWVFQEIIHERKPTVIIEIGNQAGGSTMMLRDALMNSDTDDAKYVIGIDITRERISLKAFNYPDIKWITGDGNDPEVIEKVKSMITPEDRVMVIDDSSHEVEPTYNILCNYAPLVTINQYFIVEDTLLGEFIPFGYERDRAYPAVISFMRGNKDFRIDRTREKWFATLNPEGYLEKIR